MNSGLHPSAIIKGYEKAMEKCEELLEKSVLLNIKEISDVKVLKVIESSLAPKIPNHFKHFSKIIFEGC